MRVHIDHLDALAAHAHIAMRDRGVGGARLTLPAALSPALRGCIAHEGAVCSPQSRRRTRHTFNEVSAIRHTLLLHRSNLFQIPSNLALAFREIPFIVDFSPVRLSRT